MDAASLIDVLHMRSTNHTFVAIVDFLKSFRNFLGGNNCGATVLRRDRGAPLKKVDGHFAHGTIRRSDSLPLCLWSGKIQESPREEFFKVLVDGFARAVCDAAPGLFVIEDNWDSRFAGQLYADLVMTADSAADLHSGVDAVSARGLKIPVHIRNWADQICCHGVRPKREHPSCSLTVDGVRHLQCCWGIRVYLPVPDCTQKF